MTGAVKGGTGIIGVDWGTTMLRAYLLDELGGVVEHREAADGIMAGTRDFHGTLLRSIGPWLEAGRRDVVLCGMVTSRHGWIETPYVLAPTSRNALAASLVEHRTPEGLRLWFGPGVRLGDDRHTVDVMRGEETQVLGTVEERAGDASLVVLPGSHSKWILVEDGQISWFATFMTGEVFAALRRHTILRESLRSTDADGAADPVAGEDALSRGVRLALSAGPGGGLLHQLFRIRVESLFADSDRLEDDYLSGLLLGTEIIEAQARLPERHAARPVEVIGDPALAAQYLRALDEAGIEARRGRSHAAATGMFRLARARGVV